jgi:glucokinase
MSRHLGLDLGGTNMKRAVLRRDDDDIEVLDTASAPTDAEVGPDAVVERLVALGREALASIDTVGVGVPGLFDAGTGQVTFLPNLAGDWHGYPIADRLSEGLGLPVTLVNDARGFALAETRLGAGRGGRVVVAIALGTGVGGGIVIDGRLHLGAFGSAGEIGHQTIVPDGPLCTCGNRGCVEALTKAEVLARLGGQETAEAVYEAAAGGDPTALAAVDTVAGYLGILVANAVTLLGPDRVIIGGGLAEAGDLLLEPLRAAVIERVKLVPVDRVEITYAELGPAAGAIGAALVGMDPSALGR